MQAIDKNTKIHQKRFADRVSATDCYGFFNLLTGPKLLDVVEAQLPEHRERLYTPTLTLFEITRMCYARMPYAIFIVKLVTDELFMHQRLFSCPILAYSRSGSLWALVGFGPRLPSNRLPALSSNSFFHWLTWVGYGVILRDLVDHLGASNRFQGNLGFLSPCKHLPFAFAHFLLPIFRQGIA